MYERKVSRVKKEGKGEERRKRKEGIGKVREEKESVERSGIRGWERKEGKRCIIIIFSPPTS